MPRALLSKVLNKISPAIEHLRIGGPSGLRKYLQFLAGNLQDEINYRKWIQGHESKLDAASIGQLARHPLISVVVPVYNTDEKWLRRCLDSVLNQIYPHWELCIADDASTASHVLRVLDEFAARDERVRVTSRNENGHISAASNSALELATGELVALLDHDDELSRDALFWIARELNEFPETAMIYTDEDLIDTSGRRSDPKFKPAFSRDLFYSTNLITHLAAYRTDIVRLIGGFRIGFEGSQDYDLALRVIEQIDEKQIRHIPRVLYHWRTIKGSVSYSMDEKPYAHERARTAIREHLERRGFAAEVTQASHDLHRVRYKLPVPPSVTVIVSSDDSNILDRLGDDREVITVNKSGEDLACRLNDAAARCEADVVLFIDGDLSVRSRDAVHELAAFAIQPGIGAVGGRIIGRDMLVEQAGIVLQQDLSPAFAHQGFPIDAAGNLSRNRLIGNFSAVSISCMAISRHAFEAVGGFDTDIAMFDIDLCLRLREQGKRIVVMPDVVFLRTRDHVRGVYGSGELEQFRERWSKYVEEDPFCNPNLTRDGQFRII